MLTQKYSESLIGHFHGLSTDTKPTDCSNGSLFKEMDTQKVYSFDEEHKIWYEVPADFWTEWSDRNE